MRGPKPLSEYGIIVKKKGPGSSLVNTLGANSKNAGAYNKAEIVNHYGGNLLLGPCHETWGKTAITQARVVFFVVEKV